MKHFETLTEAMEDLRERGYTAEFAPKGDFLEETGSSKQFKSDEFHVDEFHRFEGTSDPGDEMTLFGISTSNGLKGVFVFGMGAYANEASAALMQKFSISDRPDVNTEGAVQPIKAVGLAENGEQ
ncbi:hypothetical protein [Tellurirhabdus rosea]|uniref:hypothetical protein n=1 Tax=Tellurirhabdus rosea TaxID=2674997 RepID=UPI00224D6A2A|nr:hypothetical protein [Tellurirhabdus rosea]